jgi:HSP20 family protein
VQRALAQDADAGRTPTANSPGRPLHLPGHASHDSRVTTVQKEVIVVASRFDPFRELDRLADRMLSQALISGEGVRPMPLDLVREGDRWVLHCDLPGVDPQTIDISVEDRVLTIRASRQAHAEHDSGDWLIQERSSGVFARQLTLGANVDVEHIDAHYTDGVLTLELPVAEAAKPRRIEVAHNGSQQSKVIEGAPA